MRELETRDPEALEQAKALSLCLGSLIEEATYLVDCLSDSAEVARALHKSYPQDATVSRRARWAQKAQTKAEAVLEKMQEALDELSWIEEEKQ